jgi:hypothetical protein
MVAALAPAIRAKLMEAASKFLVLVCMFILMNLFESFYTILVGEKNAGLGLTEPALCLKV